MTELYWFRNDLRLEDNPALARHAEGQRLLCVYIWPRQVPWCNLTGMGAQRSRFLQESVAFLQRQLRARGQELLVLREPPHLSLPPLLRQFEVQRIGTCREAGVYEGQELAALIRAVDIPVQVHGGNTLFDRQQLPFELETLPPHYTPFREAVENLQPPAAEGAVPLPPPPPGLRVATIEQPSTAPHPTLIVRGGAEAGMQRLQNWMFRERAVEHYAETRNQLSGLFFSSLLSPWLANGGLAVRRVAALLRDYERDHGASDSSRSLYRELLWREFFHWRALADGAALFRMGGARRKRQLKTFEPRQFARWCAGATDFPLVNALMHQLVATGWMSNRGRQVVASCLVNELGHDWRYGAAFFEKHLLDHDVAVNYGNWQYIAGVGADPRGGRHFNLARQQALYDPEGEFITLWQGDCPPQPEYVTDAADWPISG